MNRDTVQSSARTPMSFWGDTYRVKYTEISLKNFNIVTTICIFLLAHSTIAVAQENIHDEPQDSKTGTIDRHFIDKIEKRTRNINGVKYEIMEVRDQINDIIANPINIDTNILSENIELVDTSKNTQAIIPIVQKKEVLITEFTKPEIKTLITKKIVDKPKIIHSLTLLPTKKILTNTVKSNVVSITERKSAYNKHDDNGTLLDHATEQWSCIHDTQNNLMWEVKSNTNDLRNANNLYSWYNPDDQSADGIADGGRCQGNSKCDTDAYVQAMNEQNYCGHNDWQLPTREQMQTLVYLKDDDKSATINKNYFPETAASWYWTASENNDDNNFAWYVLFRNGISLSDLKERPKHIRLVRKHSQQIAKY